MTALGVALGIPKGAVLLVVLGGQWDEVTSTMALPMNAGHFL